MKIFRMITGCLLLTSSIMGETTGKIGKHSLGVAEWGAYGGKNVANFAGDTANGMADSWTANGWTANGTVKFATNLTYVAGGAAHVTGDLCSVTERVSKGGKDLFAGVEQYSQDLNAYANDLLDTRKNEYRDLKLDFDWRGSRTDSQIDDEDWVIVDEFSTKSKMAKINQHQTTSLESEEVFFDALESQE